MRALFALLVVSGCAAERPLATAVAPACAPVQPRCTHLDASAIGRLPLELKVGTSSISVAEWTTPDEASSEVVGFAAHMPSDVTFTVQAGPDAFVGRGTRWLHPAGVVGRSVHGIDSITFCQVKALARCEPVAPAATLAMK